jgi:hypothetical protein
LRTFSALLVAGAAVFAAGGGCGPDPSRYDEVERWECFEDDAGCDCFGTPADSTIADPRSKVVSCRSTFDCCFVKQRTDGTFECGCLVTPPPEDGAGGEGGAGADSPRLACHATAIDHGSTEVVPRCPPVTLNDSAVCALAFEGCDREYLDENGLIACCEGTACKKNQYGQDVCQPN